MPARWRSVDAAFLPYKATRWTEACEPIKLNEIIATGLRAVGPALPALRRRAPSVLVAESMEDYAPLIASVLRPQSMTCMAENLAARNALTSWEDVASAICDGEEHSPILSKGAAA
jgi:hypothetical protein